MSGKISNEEIVLSCLIRNPYESRNAINNLGLTNDDFMPGIAKRAFEFLANRLDNGKSIEPEQIHYDDESGLAAFDGYIKGLALFAQWRLNREADGKLEKAIRDMKHQSLIRNKTGKLKRIISK